MTPVDYCTILAEDEDQRLDRWLKKHFPSLNQIKIEKLCRKGAIRINGGRVKPSKRLAQGEVVRIPPIPDLVLVPKAETKKVSDDDKAMIKRTIIYEDDSFVVDRKSVV